MWIGRGNRKKEDEQEDEPITLLVCLPLLGDMEEEEWEINPCGES